MSRKVVIELRIPMVIDIPEDWDEDTINFMRQGSCSCASNWQGYVEECFNAMDKDDACPCSVIRHRYIREATSEESEKGYTLDDSITKEISNGI